jgi:uncharacterized spore protein YtfJ
MSERSARTETLRAGTPVHVDGVTLLPIEHVAIQSEMDIVGAWFSVAKRPYALIVRDAAGIRTIDIDGAVSLPELRDNIPELDALLATM